MAKERILCPNCGASYRITVTMLQQAGQEARCAVCKEVFTINVQDVEFSTDNPELTAENVIKQLRASERRERSGRKKSAQQENPRQKEPQPGAPTFKISAPVNVTQPPVPKLRPKTRSRKRASVEKAIDTTSVHESVHETAHQRILSGQPKPTIKKKQPIALWLTGSVILAVILLSQITWLMRENPFIYTKMVMACKVLGCTPPELRSPKAISIADRLFTAIDDQPGTYQLQLNIRNHAPYPQPFPRIELSLLDSNGVVQARNRFDVEQYLAETDERILQPSMNTSIEFMVHTPAADTSGFMLDFL
jgi:predicted Zn finger-like uncharacterized protein